jgi:hypothetical protein
MLTPPGRANTRSRNKRSSCSMQDMVKEALEAGSRVCGRHSSSDTKPRLYSRNTFLGAWEYISENNHCTITSQIQQNSLKSFCTVLNNKFTELLIFNDTGNNTTRGAIYINNRRNIGYGRFRTQDLLPIVVHSIVHTNTKVSHG